MAGFIKSVLNDLIEKQLNIADLTFILPSKRAGIFLKRELASITKKTLFAPEILSIEEFVEELSQLRKVSTTELLFEFYTAYCTIIALNKRESFENFTKWAQILLQDFNEIDRFLIPQEKFFNYLFATKKIENWTLDGETTPIVKEYLTLWENMPEFYKSLSENLLSKGIGYQGLIYREAVNNLENYIQSHPKTKHVFLGFNAMNEAESTIIQELLQSHLAEIYWDIDRVFLNDPIHDAGVFIRNHKASWKYFSNNKFNWIDDSYSNSKNIVAIGSPKNVGQAKYVGELLSKMNSFEKTAVILANESLLMPVLSALPNNNEAFNITMGLPLRLIPLASLFEQLFLLQKKNTTQFYYKDVIAILTHPLIKPLLLNNSQFLVETIKTNNYVFITHDVINELSEDSNSLLGLLFNSWGNDPHKALSQCSELIYCIKGYLSKQKKENVLTLEYLYRFNELFNTLTRLNKEFKHIDSIKALHGLYKELLKSETLDFKGEPLKGLQIMGVLESRVLDFETVIITSVNEGILPAGKSNNSFIPFDLKLEFGLPTYKEKDAVYSYHFYHLIQRAKNVYLIYNTEPDVLTGGEKSRFISQLEVEQIHNIKELIVSPNIHSTGKELISIKKNHQIKKVLQEIAEKGFSPSSLSTYIRNPLDFYYQKVLGIKTYDDIEETIAANTLGTIVHNTLEDFYKPLIDKTLNSEMILLMKSKVDATINKHFKDIYKKGQIDKGKNLIIYEVAKRYVINFLNTELNLLKKGHSIKILHIELENHIAIDIPELDFPVYLTGKVDRVDEFDGVIRVIDYKTGKVVQSEVEIINWEELTTDYKKYSKSFQVLMYAYMMNLSNPIKTPVEAGIISFKNLNRGFLKFGKKDGVRSRKKDTNINQETLNCFFKELKNLILEINNIEVSFNEKEV